MKSSQFTELFQKHIFDVFYAPSSIKDGVSIVEKWRILTNELLKDVLPTAHNKAADLIEQQFFDSKIEYHFKNHRVIYEIDIDQKTHIASVKHQTETTIVLSPNVDEPQLIHSIELEAEVKLLSLRLNGKDCLNGAPFEADKNNPKLHWLKFPLKKHAIQSSDGTDLVVKLERVVSYTQDLKKDPAITVKISRFIKGATVKAKVSQGYRLYFTKFGLGELPSNHHVENDGMGFEAWELAAQNCLLLPGQSFTLIPIAL